MQPPSPRQTQSYLRRVFGERGIHPKNKLGQNFLIDLNIIDVLLRAAELTPEDLAVEVGSGTGSLTVQLVEQAGGVVSVEIDSDFARMTDEMLMRKERVALIHTDALKSKNELHPDLLKAIAEVSQRCGTSRIKLVANLPYSVAVPIISNLLLTDLVVDRMVVTVQWEIAERLTAIVGQKEYASLAIFVQSLADVEIVRKLPPSVFWPKPKVDSAIVRIRPNPVKRARVGDVIRWRNFLRDLYVHRRKNLRGALFGSPTHEIGKAEVDAKLAALCIEGTVRAEGLDLTQHLRLCEVFG